MKTSVIAIAAVAVIVVAGAGVAIWALNNGGGSSNEYTVTLEAANSESTAFTYSIDDGEAVEYSEAFKVKEGQKVTFTSRVSKTGYLFEWEDKTYDTKTIDSVKADVTVKGETKSLVTMIADSIVNNYEGKFGGNSTGKFTKDASSTDTLVILNGYTKDANPPYTIEIGCSTDVATKLSELKQVDIANKYDKYKPEAKASAAYIEANTTFENFDAYWYNYAMKKGSSTMYFGFSLRDVYVSGYNGLSTFGGNTIETGARQTFDQALGIFEAAAKDTPATFEGDVENTIARYVALNYTGDFGAYSAADGKLTATKTNEKTYGPMVFKAYDTAAAALAQFNANSAFVLSDVCTYDLTDSSKVPHGYGLIADTEGNLTGESMVYSEKINDFDGFHGLYASRKMGSSVANPMYFVACYKNIYISSAAIGDGFESNYQYIGGPTGTYIHNEDLTALLTCILNGISLVHGEFPVVTP